MPSREGCEDVIGLFGITPIRDEKLDWNVIQLGTFHVSGAGLATGRTAITRADSVAFRQLAVSLRLSECRSPDTRLEDQMML